MTKHERELQGIKGGLNYLPRSINETKLRGRKLKSAHKQLRKAEARFEVCRIACLSLPKHWASYAQKRQARGYQYGRLEVNNMHGAIERLDRAKDNLRRAQESYADRFTDRQKYRDELRALPDQIACLKSLIEIADKKRKPKKEKTATSKWIEVTPGYFVEKYRIVTYCRTLPDEPVKNVLGGFYVISHHSGYAKFALKQFHPGTTVECHAD